MKLGLERGRVATGNKQVAATLRVIADAMDADMMDARELFYSPSPALSKSWVITIKGVDQPDEAPTTLF